MMFGEIKQIKTDKKDIRRFGITIGIVLLLIAMLMFYKEKEGFQILLLPAVIFVSTSMIIPTLLKPIYIAWMSFAVILGWFMTKVILCLLFFLIITPTGLISRFFGKDFLGLKKEASNGSYWNLRESSIEKNQNYKKQF